MAHTDLWRYCTAEDCREMLLSFRLLEGDGWTDERIMACLYALSNHVEKHYETVRIPKKSGGVRTLFVPDPLLKQVQKRILHHILEGFELPSCATAYHKKASAAANAAAHAGKAAVLKLDIEDFFGSISFPSVLSSAFSSLYFPPAVGTLLAYLCCCRECLPQGAPTSPAISNLVMRPFDIYMDSWCSEQGITYTRYCDDMTFSGEFDVAAVRRKAAGFLKKMGFTLNRKKTRILRRGNRQTVTGIVVNERPQLSKEYRRKLRQELYYCERFGVKDHLGRVGSGRRSSDRETDVGHYLETLLGKVNYVLLVNPDDAWSRSAKGRIREMLDVCEKEEGM